MIFGNQLRSSKTTALLVSAIVFMAIFVGLIYNHLDTFQGNSNIQSPPPVVVDDPSSVVPPPEKEPEKEPEKPTETAPEEPEVEVEKPAESSAPEEEDKPEPPKTNDPTTTPALPLSPELQFYFDKVVKPSIKPDQRMYRAWGAIDHKIEDDIEIKWKKPIGEKLCIIDMDNRKFNESGELWGPETMTWDNAEQVHGLSLGILNHWVYAKIHGYKYYYIDLETYADRRNSWKKPPIISQILKEHDTCIFLDSDAVFYNLDLPFEWLMNYWQLHPSNNSLALAYDPGSNNNKDKFGTVYLNTGFLVAQNNPKTYEIMDAWQDCPNDGGKHPDCTEFRTNRPGKPTDQGGFGTFIRYDYPDDIVGLKCTEANGFPESHSGCDGQFIRHLWTGKKSWIKALVGQQLPGAYLELAHQGFLGDKPSYYMTEKELMGSKGA